MKIASSIAKQSGLVRLPDTADEAREIAGKLAGSGGLVEAGVAALVALLTKGS